MNYMDTFPPNSRDKSRLADYEQYQKIFLGEHYDIFGHLSKDLKKDYKALQYLTANFGGLISRLSADMLFEEFPTITLPKGDMDFFSEMMDENHLEMQIYESGLEQSYNGDVIFRMRADNGNLVIEDINPAFWFPEINEGNVRAEPTAHRLAWKVKVNVDGKVVDALFVERHTKGKIEYKLYQMESEKIVGELDVSAYMTGKDGNPLQPEVETKVDDFLIVHIPNYRINTRYFGISDYKDLLSLIFAINKRLTNIDIILDKHGEPILAVPQGVLDDSGKIPSKKFGMIEIVSGQGGEAQKPEYIVWDAKLESAFSQIEKMVEFLMMFSDTNPAILGLDTGGVAESGRALKYRLLRTLAKKHRKELYYDIGLKRLFYTAQKFAKANNLKCGGKTMQGEAVKPLIQWQDGIINDALETLEYEERRLEAGLTTKVDAIATLDSIKIEEAEDKLKKINKEKEEMAPKFTANPLFAKNGKDNMGAQDDKTTGKDNKNNA